MKCLIVIIPIGVPALEMQMPFAIHFCKEAPIKNDQFSKLKSLISNSYFIRKSF